MADQTTSILGLTANIVSAHISNNGVAREVLSSLIQEVYHSLARINDIPAESAAAPAVPVNKSVFPEFIICLESGQKMKMLKRHLMTNYNLSPEAYRAKWGLPADYPMVAPAYASIRSQLAKKSGLGKRKPELVSMTPARRALPARSPRHAAKK